jgi:c-di-GMP-binding flagellar brake protein YcgR
MIGGAPNSMAESEKIKGAAIPKLFEELLHHKTLLKLTVVDTAYEHLTLITALVNRNKGPHFAIDTPEGFEQASAEIDPWHLHFEFTGKDHIKYTFRCTGGEIDENRIYVKYPREIDRWQRRELFRLNAPAGTKLCLPQDALRYELDVIDISIGGTLAALVRTSSRDLENPPFANDQILTDIELVFPSEIMRQPIMIKTAQLKRLRKNPEKTGYEVAFEFYEISTGEQNRLTDLIYRLQRQALRNRLPLDFEK